MFQLYLLDTKMVSYIVKGRSPAARARLAGLSRDEIACLSALTKAELLYGMATAGSGEERRRSLAWLLARLQVHPRGRDAAGAYGTLRAKQEAMGKTLGRLDMQIAAHAIALGARLIRTTEPFSMYRIWLESITGRPTFRSPPASDR